MGTVHGQVTVFIDAIVVVRAGGAQPFVAITTARARHPRICRRGREVLAGRYLRSEPRLSRTCASWSATG